MGRAKPLVITTCLVLGVFAGASAYTFSYAEGLSYLSNDPKACVNCHIMREQYDGWQKAAHHAHATCNDCHVPHDFIGKYFAKAEHGWRHSKAFTLQDFHEPIQITPADRDIVQDNCRRCHMDLTSEIVQHAVGPGAPEDSGRIDCTHCHAAVGHGPKK